MSPRTKPKAQPTNADLQEAFDAHAQEDHTFQEDTRAFNGEMSIFRAETEGSLSELHQKMDAMLDKFDPKKEQYAFTKMDMMFEVYEGLGFSKRMLMVVAAVVGSLAIIIGGVFSTVRGIK